MSIRTRLFLTFLILVGLGFFLLTRSITREFGPRYLAAMEESMVDMATVLSSFLEARAEDKVLDVGNLRTVFESTGDLILFLREKTAYHPEFSESMFGSLSEDVGTAALNE